MKSRLVKGFIGSFIIYIALYMVGGTYLAAPALAQTTQTITLMSSNGSIGSRDLNNQFTLDGGITWQNAYIVSPHPLYHVIPGTQYINRNSTYTGPTYTSTRYRTIFELPNNFSDPSLNVQVHADNVATIYLNGVRIGKQAFAEIRSNFQNPAESYSTNSSTLFKTGKNTLEFDIYNFGGPTAFNYKAVVSFSGAGNNNVESDTLVIASSPGDAFTYSGSNGQAVLTYGHVGCKTISRDGFCLDGVWPKIGGARWIWKTQNVSNSEALSGIPQVVFKKNFNIPEGATATGSIKITADNGYVLYLNGQKIGADGSWPSIETYTISPRVGLNTLEIRVVNYTQRGGYPYSNPAGLIYRADIIIQKPRTESTYFIDGFNGNSLDADLWNTSFATMGNRWCSSTVQAHHSNPGEWRDVSVQSCNGLKQAAPYGSLVITNGQAKFSAGSIRAFPYISSGYPGKVPFPSAGDFALEVRMKFDSIQSHGTGFSVLRWANADPVGNNPPSGSGGVFGIWSDRGIGGVRASLLGQRVTITNPLDFHIYRLEYVDGKYSLFVDGIMRLQQVSNVRPNAIWAGNPVFTHWGISDWTDFTMDYVKVSSLGNVVADTTPPTGAILINNNATYTNTANVTLNLYATDAGSGVSQMRFSNDNSIWTSWENYATSKSWTLTSGNGTKTVYVQYKDVAGNISTTYSDTIILDQTPPEVSAGSDKITNDGFTQTGFATDENGVASVQWSKVSGPGTVTFGSPESQETTVSASVEGTYVLRLTATDKAGNSAYSDMALIWDQTPPNSSGYYPEPGAVRVPVTTAITATISDDLSGVDESTINENTFYLTGLNDTAVLVSVVYDPETGTATLTPVSDLGYSITYTVTLSDGIKDKAGNSLVAYSFSFTTPPIPANIDIKPGSDPNPINLKNKGVIPVAILGSLEFDVTQVDAQTVRFGPGEASMTDKDGRLEDVNDDGYMDMVLHFKTQESGIQETDTSATLTGQLLDGRYFEGSDSVKIVNTPENDNLGNGNNNGNANNSNANSGNGAGNGNSGNDVNNNSNSNNSANNNESGNSSSNSNATNSTNANNSANNNNTGNVSSSSKPQKKTVKDKTPPKVSSVRLSSKTLTKGKTVKAYYKVTDNLSPKLKVTIQIRTTKGKILSSVNLGAKKKGAYSKSIKAPKKAGTYVYSVIVKDHAGNTTVKNLKFVVK